MFFYYYVMYRKWFLKKGEEYGEFKHLVIS